MNTPLAGPAKSPDDSALREARAAWQRGDAAQAEAHCREALAADASNAEAWTMLAIVLRKRDPGKARAALSAALQLAPQHPDAWFHLGNLERESGHPAEAISAYQAAARAQPMSASIPNNLGLAREACGDEKGAEAAYKKALELVPAHRQALGNLAHLLCRLRRYAEALPLCEEYLRRYPDADATTWVDRGICLHHAGDHPAAEASFQRALALAPDDPLVMINVATLLAERDAFERAAGLLERAVAQEPSNAYALSLLAHSRSQLCAWDGIDELHQRIAQSLRSGTGAVNAFSILSTPLSPELQLRAAQRWTEDFTPSVPRSPATAAPCTARLRLGYVSSDFRTHATASLLAEVWERHDRARIETFAYSIGPPERSPLRDRIALAFDRFVDVSGESVEGIARRIAGDGIGVLIDLNGYTTHAKSELFALKPAPVQVSWLGYLGTLGAPWYDYVLTDRFAAPAQLQQHFSERFLYLPDCYCPSDTRRPVAASAPSRAECGLPPGALVFCCFNQAYKILPEVFAVWMRLLAQVPHSVLWLAPAQATARENLRREAAARGVEAQRLIFAPKLELPEHLARHVHADLFLDTTPYNAGTTANDALFMAVPVLTCSGETLASRVAGSQLQAIGLPELITSSLAQYEALALALAREPTRLTELRHRLQANRHTMPLFDMARFARALDDLLHAAWENRDSVMAPPSTSA